MSRPRYSTIAPEFGDPKLMGMKMISRSIAVAGLTLGLAIAASGIGPAAWAQDEMQGVDLLHPGAQFMPRMPSGLTPAGPLEPPGSAHGGPLEPAFASSDGPLGPSFDRPVRMAPGTQQIHPPTRAPNFFDACTGAFVGANNQIGSDRTFCGFGRR